MMILSPLILFRAIVRAAISNVREVIVNQRSVAARFTFLFSRTRWHMKRGNFTGLTPLVAATLLLSAWIIQGLAAEPKKDTAASKSAATFKPTNATPAQLKAKLKAKVDPKLVVVHKRTPSKYVAFELKDFRDKSGKVPTANESVTLPNGTKSQWGKYHRGDTTKSRKGATAEGYTVRGTGKTFKVQELRVNDGKLTAEAKRKLPVAKEPAAVKALLVSPKAAEAAFKKKAAAAKSSKLKILPPPGVSEPSCSLCPSRSRSMSRLAIRPWRRRERLGDLNGRNRTAPASSRKVRLAARLSGRLKPY